MTNRRDRYLRRESDRKSRTAQQLPASRPPDVIPDAHASRDADYAAYLASLDGDADHAAFLGSLGEPPELPERPLREKVTWHRNHNPGDNWHDYLVCQCGTCARFRKINGVPQWNGGSDLFAESGQPDPWDSSDLRRDTEI
jgi:hypothetical protein